MQYIAIINIAVETVEVEWAEVVALCPEQKNHIHHNFTLNYEPELN